MGRLSFAEAIYLILRGELPIAVPSASCSAPSLVSSIDHGVTPPSTLAARNVATTGAPLARAPPPGVLGLRHLSRRRHRELHAVPPGGPRPVSARAPPTPEAAERILEAFDGRSGRPPGFGHRIHTSDPRASRLLQMAHELELDGEHVRMIRAIERVLTAPPGGRRPPAADERGRRDCGRLRRPRVRAGAGQRAVHHRARARASSPTRTRSARASTPMRQIDPKDSVYDGPPPRRLPDNRAMRSQRDRGVVAAGPTWFTLRLPSAGT